jgi:Arc/MetJ-type ribon-helix-helix transcriptional regulator
MKQSKKSVTVRLPDELIKELQRATDTGRDPYAPSITKVVERGVRLALLELERKRK